MSRHIAGNDLYFYQRNKLRTIKQDNQNVSVFRNESLALAEQHHATHALSTQLLASDPPGSIVVVSSEITAEARAYTPYGHYSTAQLSLSLLAYNGEAKTATGVYLLGNGYRAYNLTLMRFHTADTLSPFGIGGMNAYTYCEGDPTNNIDPSGRFKSPWFLAKYFGGSARKATHYFNKNQRNVATQNNAASKILYNKAYDQKNDYANLPLAAGMEDRFMNGGRTYYGAQSRADNAATKAVKYGAGLQTPSMKADSVLTNKFYLQLTTNPEHALTVKMMQMGSARDLLSTTEAALKETGTRTKQGLTVVNIREPSRRQP